MIYGNPYSTALAGSPTSVSPRSRARQAPLDVWWQYPTQAEPERRPSHRPFHELSNVLITPHSSSSTEATADRRWSAVAANLDRFARGEKLENIVLQT
jgi:phosphoglycerate dehydrogenase-like enzyme